MTHPDKKITQVVILAAGKGTRMKSDIPKVLHEIAGKPMILHLLETLQGMDFKKTVIVVGYGKQEVIKTVEDWLVNYPTMNVEFCEQLEQNGTGDAVLSAKEYLKDDNGYLLVLLGDVPFIKRSTIEKASEKIISDEALSLVMSTTLTNPTGYGRIYRNGNGYIKRIIEEKDASVEEKKISEINTGVFIYDNVSLWHYIDHISTNNAQQEYYLTDLIDIYNQNNKTVSSYLSEDSNQFRGINSPEQLLEVEKSL